MQVSWHSEDKHRWKCLENACSQCGCAHWTWLSGRRQGRFHNRALHAHPVLWSYQSPRAFLSLLGKEAGQSSRIQTAESTHFWRCLCSAFLVATNLWQLGQEKVKVEGKWMLSMWFTTFTIDRLTNPWQMPHMGTPASFRVTYLLKSSGFERDP